MKKLIIQNLFIYTLIVLLLIVLASLLSYNSTDLEIYQFPEKTKVSNWLGKTGSHISARLYLWLGWSIFILLIGFFCSSLFWLYQKKQSNKWRTLLGWFTVSLLLTSWGCVILAFFCPDSKTILAGGLIGFAIKSLLVVYFGKYASIFVVVASLSGAFWLFFSLWEQQIEQSRNMPEKSSSNSQGEVTNQHRT